ncbi:PREDICTED: uncharacterized protein LOC106149892, partial [Chinchilla lanigera]|uniref:uncharacterized protein LOC106149892 n=1 Tax=Chinchilla lanigera TaxID=34839 RepID=UPI000696607A
MDTTGRAQEDMETHMATRHGHGNTRGWGGQWQRHTEKDAGRDITAQTVTHTETRAAWRTGRGRCRGQLGPQTTWTVQDRTGTGRGRGPGPGAEQRERPDELMGRERAAGPRGWAGKDPAPARSGPPVTAAASQPGSRRPERGGRARARAGDHAPAARRGLRLAPPSAAPEPCVAPLLGRQVVSLESPHPRAVWHLDRVQPWAPPSGDPGVAPGSSFSPR